MDTPFLWKETRDTEGEQKARLTESESKHYVLTESESKHYV